MMRLLVCFAYYFRGQRILPWISACGAGLIVLALFTGGTSTRLVALGAVLLAGVPILIGGFAYRQLISNRRVALVPDIRVFATAALFLVALGGAGLSGFVALYVVSRPDPWHVAQIAFAAISLYLVISQWVITHRTAALLFFVVPLIVLRLAVTRPSIVWEQLFVPWAWVALAGLAWLWLAISTTAKGVPRRMAASGTAAAEVPVSRGASWLRGGHTSAPRIATAFGTLLRGSGDGWRSRVTAALSIVLLLPIVMGAALAIMEMPQRNPETGRFAKFLLDVSFMGCLAIPGMLFADWPIRLRLVWLRVAGDRLALWRNLERMLFRELLLVAVVVLCVAAGFLFWSDASRPLVYLYVAGALLASVTGSYLGFLARISGWYGGTVKGLPVGFVILLMLTSQLWTRISDRPFAVLWLLSLFAVLALVARSRAHSRFLRMDWCKVRPLRFPRRLT